MSASDRDGPESDPLAESRRGRALTVTAAAAHDLRSAVATVAAAADLLVAGGLDETQRSYVATMRHVADDMLALLRDILEAERREAAEPSIEPQVVDLPAFLDRVSAALAVRTAAKGLACAFRCAPGMPRRVIVDPVRLGQIVSNLIDNAVKVTDAGAVRVSVGLESEAAGPGTERAAPVPTESAQTVRLVLTVEDDGPGLADGGAEQIFEPYAQGPDSARRGGLGLGLAIVKVLAERMGGGVRAETRRRGAAFVVWVRCGLARGEQDDGVDRNAAPAARVDGGQSGRRSACLVVDDNPVSRALAAALLGGLGHQAVEAASGEEAVRLVAAQAFDLVFLDLRMAPVDGIETARRIRALGERGGMPLVAVTAEACSDELRAGGFAAHVVKPVTAAALDAAARQALAAVQDARMRA